MNQSHLVLLLLLLVLLSHASYLNFVEDDAFISFRYARNFAMGLGLVFNPGERVEGYTNFLYVVVLGFLYKLGLTNLVFNAKLMGFLSAAGVVVLVYKTSKLISGDRTILFNYIACCFLVLNGSFALWTLGGMETHLFTFLIALGSYLYLRKGELSIAGTIIFYLAFLTRPEGLLFFFVTVSHKITKNITGKSRCLLKEDVLPIALFVIFSTLYMSWRYSYYGLLFPNTFYNKVDAGLEQYLRSIRHIAEFTRDFGGIMFTLPIILFVRKKVESWTTYLLSVVVVYLTYVLYIGGESSVMYRMFVPVLLAIYILIQEAIIDLYSLLSKKTVFIFFVPLLLLYTLTPSFYGKTKLDVFAEREIQGDRSLIADWLKQKAQRDDSLALNAIGEIPFTSELYTTDMLGLTEVYIAHKKRLPADVGIPGHEKYDSDYVLNKKPTYIILGIANLNPTSNETDYLKRIYLFPSDRDMLDNPQFREKYKFTSVQIGDKFFNYYTRKAEQ